MAQSRLKIDAAIAAGMTPEEALAQAGEEDESYLDPFEFLGIQKPAGATGGPSMKDVPAEAMDPREFLGIAPGTLMAPTQSARSAAPASSAWGYPQQFASGAAFGFGPELQGLEQHLRGGSPLTLEQQIANARGAKSAFEKENPLLAKPTEIAGTIPSTIAVNALTPGLSAGMRSASPTLRVGANMLAGAEAGALQHRVTGRNDLVGDVLLGATTQGAMPFVGKGLGRVLTPKVSTGVSDLVRDLETEGVHLRPSQVAMSQALRRADELLASSGNEQQLKDFTRALSRSFGENTDQLTGKVAGQAMDRIEAARQGIIGQTQVNLDATLNSEMARVGASMKGAPSAAQQQVREAIREIKKSFVNLKLDGDTYKRLTEKGGIIHNLASDNNASVSAAGRRFRELLDDAVERSSGPDVRAAWAENRAQMKNLMAVQPLLEGNVTGIVDPQKLHGQVRKFFSEYGWGKSLPGNMERLAEGGRLMPRVTPQGDPVQAEKLPWYMRSGVVLPGLGLGELYLMQANPKAAAALAGTAVLGTLGKKGVGSYLKSDFARNALTGAQVAPGTLTTALKPALVGGANALKAQFEEDEEEVR